MISFYPIFLKELIVLKRRFSRGGYFLSSLFTPLLYFLAFGLGLGKRIEMEGVSYLKFLLPGLVALSSTSESFNWNALSLSLSRMYYKTFEEYSTSPMSAGAIVIGYTLSGCLKGMFTSLMIILVGCFFGLMPPGSVLFYGVLFLNSLVFSSLGVITGLLARSYNDVSIFSNFFVLPMTFLCGTFFSLTKFPQWIKGIVFYLPLTQTSMALRASFLERAFPFGSLTILLLYLGLFYLMALLAMRRKT